MTARSGRRCGAAVDVARRRQRRDQVRGVRHRGVMIAVFEGYDCQPTAEGAARADHPHRGDLVPRSRSWRWDVSSDFPSWMFVQGLMMESTTARSTCGSACSCCGVSPRWCSWRQVGRQFLRFQPTKDGSYRGVFDNIGGLRCRGQELRVLVGLVAVIRFDPKSTRPSSTSSMDDRYAFPSRHHRLHPDLRPAGRASAYGIGAEAGPRRGRTARADPRSPWWCSREADRPVRCSTRPPTAPAQSNK